MKAFAVILTLFVAVIIVVFRTGYYSRSETPAKTLPVKAEAPIYKPKPEEPKQQEPKIVYVPQVIEKVYVREVVRTEHVYHEPQREYQQASYQPSNRDTQDYSCCSSFTGEAKDNCQRTVRKGGTCQQYQAKITYYRFQN